MVRLIEFQKTKMLQQNKMMDLGMHSKNYFSRTNNSLRRVYEIASYLSAPKCSMLYIGWLGMDNLGDEVLFNACQPLFGQSDLVHIRTTKQMALINYLIKNKRHKCVILGGGTLIWAPHAHGESNDCYKRFSNSAAKAQCSIVFGTGVDDLNINDEDIVHRNLVIEWLNLFQKCRFIGVRGPDSYKRLKAIGVESKIIGDLACSLVQSKGYWSPDKKTLGINVGLIPGFTPEQTRVFTDELVKFIRGIIKKGWGVEFFCVWPKDLETVNLIARAADIYDPIIHEIYHNENHYFSNARRMSAFIGVKLHAVILAMCAHVPSIMISYKPKCIDFMKSIEMESFCINACDLKEDQLTDQMDNLLISAKSISNKIEDHLIYWKNLQNKEADTILKMLDNIN